MQDLSGERPEIDYPCSWPYRIVCTDEPAVRAALVVIVGAAQHSVQNIGASSSGRYQRLELVVEVRDEEHRNQIFVAIEALSEVRFML